MNPNTSFIASWMGAGVASLALAVSPQAPSSGSGSPPTLAPVPPADYSKGFQKLGALGLPDTATGTYVHLELRGANDSGGYGWEYEMKMKGNGWLLRQDTNGQAVVVIGQARTLTVWDPKTLARLRQREHGKPEAGAPAGRTTHPPGSESDGRIAGTWKAVDFTNDLARAQAFIDAARASGKSSDEDEPFARREGSRRLNDLQGPLFLFAAHAWRRGYTNEANRIAATLFAVAGDPRKVILVAVNHLADEQYKQVYAQFTTRRDWAAFHTGLTGLMQRYPQGWRARPGVALLASNVALRVAGTIPAPVGEGLGAADLELALELARMTSEPEDGRSGELWLLDPPGTPAPADPLGRLTDRRTAAVPLLAALVQDPWLLPFDRSFLQRRSSYYSSSDDSEDQQARQAYDRLDRPVSRGDIALALLRQIVMGGDNQYEVARKSDEEIRDLALEFHKASANATPLELARRYFTEGTSEQRQAALPLLLKSPVTSDVALVEAQLADSSKVSDNLTALNTYVEVRGAAARPLMLALASDLGLDTAPKPAATNAAPAETPESDDSGRDYQRKQIRDLLALTSDQSLESLMADLLSDKAAPSASRRLLIQRIGQGDRNASLGLLLDTAIKATNAAARTQVIGYMRYLKNSGSAYGRSRYAMQTASEDEPVWTPDLARHQASWAVLLADGRRVARGAAAASVAESAATVVEHLYAAPPREDKAAPAAEEGGDEEEDSDVDRRFGEYGGYYLSMYMTAPSAELLTQLTGTRGREFILARARARVAGASESALAPYPQAGNVKDERRKALLATLADAAAAPTTLESLTLDERLWLATALTRQTNLNVRLAPLSRRIVDVSGPAGDTQVEALAKAWKGRALERKTLESLIDHVKERLLSGEARQVTIRRQPAFDGVAIHVETMADARRNALMDRGDYAARAAGKERAVVGSLEGAQAVWPVAAAEAAVTPSATRALSEVDALLAEAVASVKADAGRLAAGRQDRFWKAVDALDSSNAAAERTVIFTGIDPAAPAPAESGEGDDEPQPVFVD